MDDLFESVINKLTKYNITKQDVDYYISTPERKSNGFATVVTNKGKVFKIPLGGRAVKTLFKIVANNNLFYRAGLKVVRMDIENNIGIMDRVYADTVVEYVQNCIRTKNKHKIFECLTLVYNDILVSSECINKINKKFCELPNINIKCRILKFGFTEILPQNTFYLNGKMMYFDQEIREDNIPAEYIFARYVRHLYYEVPSLHFFVSLQEMLEYYSDVFKDFWKDFSKIGYESYTSFNVRMINIKQIMKLNKNIYIVGAGNWCVVFLDILEQYNRLSDVKLILDNDERKWGNSILGIEIKEFEKNIDKLPQEGCIVVAIKEYEHIKHKLELLDHYNAVFLIHFNNYEIKLTRFGNE